MKRNVIPSIVKISIILILACMSLESIAVDLVSIITDISVTQQEELLCQEYEQVDFSQYATLVGFGVNRRPLSRSIGARYEYKIDQEKVEMYCVEKLKKIIGIFIK